MKKNLLFVLPFLPLFLTAQVEQATLLGQWSDDDNIVVVDWLQSRYNEVWGVAINDAEVGIIGSTMGAHFIDVTDPTNPTQIALIEGMDTGTDLVHRDYHDYGGYLYAVADEGDSGLEIMDLSDLPDSVERVYASNEFIETSHNIFIDEANARLYAVSGRRANGQQFNVLILDISNPSDPQLLAQYPNGISGVPFPNNHDLYVRDNVAYVNAGQNGLYVYDFTDATAPLLLGTMTQYPQSGYNHAGWLDEEGRYYYMLDETHGRDIKTVDVCDFGDIETVHTFDAEATASTSIPHNAIVHCNRLYVSYYYEGLQVYDLSENPAEPQRIYEYDTYPGADEAFFAGAWGVYPLLPSGNILLSDLQTGLYVFAAIEDDCTYDVLADCDTSNDGTSSVRKNTVVTDLNIFPQPAGGEVNLSFNVPFGGETDFFLRDMQGKSVQTFSRFVNAGANNFTFDLRDTPAGLYFLEMRHAEFNATTKVVLNH